MISMGYRGRRRNLAWWRNKPSRSTNAAAMGNPPRFRNIQGSSIYTGPAGYRYVGYCRCGYGPNAYYKSPDGSLVSAYQMFSRGMPQSQSSYPSVPVSTADQEKILKERLEHLQEEIAEVTNQLEDLEGKKKRFPFRWRQK